MIRLKSCFIAISLAAVLAAPVWSQTELSAPQGWKVQTKANGAHQFTPPDLAAGEVYSVTIYDSVSLQGKTLEEYLRAFAGPVGTVAGKLGAPLKMQTRDGRLVSGSGVYVGPNNTKLIALFIGVTLDGGQNIHMARTLFSAQDGLLARYSAAQQTLLEAVMRRAKAEAGDNVLIVPDEVKQKLKTIGGPLKPGVYAGNQYHDQELHLRLRVYLYQTGEYRICNDKDEDLSSYSSTGNIDYNRNSGKLDLAWTMGLGFHGDDQFCYFGRDAQGKPVIYAEDSIGYSTRTMLTWVEPPLKRLSKMQEDEQKAALEAERNRFKWVTAPSQGVPTAQIAGVLLDSKFNGQSSDETVYLLLKDGTVYADLPVPPDELDIVRSRQKEPDKWGKWRLVSGGYKVSWAGAPYQTLPGSKVLPSPAQVKLQGRWGTGTSSNNIITSSYALWGVTFTRNGRFKKDSRGGSSSSIGFGDNATNTYSGYDDEGSFVSSSGPNVVLSSEQKRKNPNANREGDYSINGYVLTLRYDNGKVARLPFFFLDAAHKGLWFEGASMSKDKK